MVSTGTASVPSRQSDAGPIGRDVTELETRHIAQALQMARFTGHLLNCGTRLGSLNSNIKVYGVIMQAGHQFQTAARFRLIAALVHMETGVVSPLGNGDITPPLKMSLWLGCRPQKPVCAVVWQPRRQSGCQGRD